MTTSISNIIKGIIISFITTIIFLLIFSVILTYTNISENFITPTIIVMTANSKLENSKKRTIKWSYSRRNIFNKYIFTFEHNESKICIINAINCNDYIWDSLWNVWRNIRCK